MSLKAMFAAAVALAAAVAVGWALPVPHENEAAAKSQFTMLELGY